MAMYWPEKKMALEIVDDPLAEPFDRSLPGEWSVLQVTMADVLSLEGSRAIGDKLSEMLGMEPPEKTPEWLAANERLHKELTTMV